MHCKTCHGPASGACRLCGGFYCAKHGGVWRRGPICALCFENVRRKSARGTVIMAGLGAVILSAGIIGAIIGRAGGIVLMAAIVALFVCGPAVLVLQEANRPNPWADRPRDE
jgi:hypothetical protein